MIRSFNRAVVALLALALFAQAATITTIEKSRARSAVGNVAGCTVSGATNATPIVVTCSAAHSLIDGDNIQILSVGGNTNANGNVYAKVTGYSTTTFGVYSDAALATAVAGNASYTSGGTVAKAADVSSFTGDFTIRIRYDRMTATKRALVSLQESSDGFASDNRTLTTFYVTSTGTSASSGVDVIRKKRDMPLNRFGTAGVTVRLYVQVIDSAASYYESFYIEQ